MNCPGVKEKRKKKRKHKTKTKQKKPSTPSKDQTPEVNHEVCSSVLTPGECKGLVLVNVPQSKSLGFPLLCISFAEFRNSHSWVKRRKKENKSKNLKGVSPHPSPCKKQQDVHALRGPAGMSRTGHCRIRRSNTFIYSFPVAQCEN